MERPNRDKILKEFNDKNYVAYGSSIENEYHKRIELYVIHLEKQLLLHDVSQQRELLIKCLIEWECSDESEDIKAFKDWIDKRPHLINCG